MLLDKRVRRARTVPVVDIHVETTETFLLESVHIARDGIPGLASRTKKGLVQRIERFLAPHAHRAISTAIFIGPLSPRLHSLEVRQHARVGPALRALGFPALVIMGIAAQVYHAIDQRGATEPDAARMIDHAAVQSFLRYSWIPAHVPAARLEVLAKAAWYAHRPARVRRPLLDQENPNFRLFRQSTRNNAACRPGPNDHVLIRGRSIHFVASNYALNITKILVPSNNSISSLSRLPPATGGRTRTGLDSTAAPRNPVVSAANGIFERHKPSTGCMTRRLEFLCPTNGLPRRTDRLPSAAGWSVERCLTHPRSVAS